MPNPVTIQFRRGPFTKESVVTLLEGEPDLEGIILPDTTTLELLYIGGHDAHQKLMGGGFQMLTSDFSKVIAPQGAAVIDTNSNIWVSTGSSWKEVGSSANSGGGGSGGVITGILNLDCGSYW